MGRRNDHSSEEFDQMVLQAAWGHLQENSADSLSLRKLAGLIGYAPSTLVSTYGSYSLLLLRVNGHTLELLAQALAPDPQLPPREQLLHLALGYLQFARQHPHAFRLVFEHKMPQSQGLPVSFTRQLEGLFGRIEGPLAALQPGLARDHLKLYARTLWASVHGICLLDIDDKLFFEGGDGQAMVATLLGQMLDKEPS
ncbi:TetR-like C-terminal domain-containing protein [Gallaecimonas xiamenensis]|uniref:Transcriptional regulator n=1 Tax=Gallaecimonas xiamenensis 3-C-1 TaxID=745411 RepID=K2JZ66_9GAMM|nr:TetR-like C-terminal domain-containing protein [Gallaecimonas xiamenensis]EKE70580.1 transcriptional regulator [Gallaecimonas xiamenensis 3-C-1]